MVHRFCYVKCTACKHETEALTGKAVGAILNTPCPACQQQAVKVLKDVPRRNGRPHTGGRPPANRKIKGYHG